MQRTAVDVFHHTVNYIDPHINFTIEHEENGQIAFLDSLVSRKNGTIAIDVYQKPTHTDRYLDYSSNHDKQHKISAARTLIHRSSLLPNGEEVKVRKLNHVSKALVSNGCPKKVISEIINKQKREIAPCPEELVSMFFKWVIPLLHTLDTQFYRTYKSSPNRSHKRYKNMTLEFATNHWKLSNTTWNTDLL